MAALQLLAVIWIIAHVPSLFAQQNPPPSSPNTNASSIAPVVTKLTNYISFYEPTYFIVGNYPAVEFQFSIKAQLFYLKEPIHPLTDLYFGYTQTSFWDLFSRSPSFFDTSYKPSGFVYMQDLLHDKDSSLYRLDLQSGVEHESNGRGGTDERSMNTAYLQPTAALFGPDGLELSLTPRAWFYITKGDNNPDIARFHGYVDLLTAISWTEGDKLAWNERWQIATMVHVGSGWDKGSVTVDLSCSLFRYFHWTPRIFAQYFAGYEQTLRQYNQISHGYRIGISLFD